MSARVTVAGNREIDRKLERLLGRETVGAMKRAARKAVEATILPAVRAEAPHGETGDLARSAVVSVDRGDRIVARVVVGDQTRPNPDVPYHAAAVEFGTGDRPPDGFMRRAFDATKGEARDRFAALLADEIQALAKG